jgi:hypothetical protein
MAEFKVWSNEGKDRLYIQVGGFFKDADAKRALAALSSELETLQPEFDVVTDYSKFVPASPKGVDGLKTGAEMVKQRGRRRAVRVTGAIVTGLMQFKRIMGGVFEDDETIRYAGSIAEADAVLDSWDQTS